MNLLARAFTSRLAVLLVPVMLLCGITLAPSTAHAAPRPLVASDDGGFTLVKKGSGKKNSGSSGSMQYMKGEIAWLVAGAVGALVPLVFLAIPFIWSPWFGVLWLPALVVAVVWAALTVGAGGGVAWLIQALFSDMRSGWVIPIAVSAGIGALGVILTALVTAVVFAPFWFWGWWWSGFSPYYFGYQWYAGPGGLGAFLAFCIWTVGIVATSIIGPMVGAFLFRKLGEPRNGNKISFEPFTGSDLGSDLGSLGGGGGSGGGGGGSRSSDRASSDEGGGGGGSNKGRGGSGKAGRPAGKVVGGSCGGDKDCAQRCAKGDKFGSGMCTMGCSTGKKCPGSTTCVDSHGGVCAITCNGNSDCPDGLECQLMSTLAGSETFVCVSG